MTGLVYNLTPFLVGVGEVLELRSFDLSFCLQNLWMISCPKAMTLGDLQLLWTEQRRRQEPFDNMLGENITYMLENFHDVTNPLHAIVLHVYLLRL